MGLTSVPDDQLATVVTTLEMNERPRPRPVPASRLRLQRWPEPEPTRYRALFKRVGEHWLWFSRLVMDDASLLAIIHDRKVELYAAVDPAGVEIGMLELDFRHADAAELSYLGLVPELTGHGHGGWLMMQALGLLWRPGVKRVSVNTCTLDHPAALGFYRRHGFRAVRRTVETFIDPRAAGVLPPDAAPQIPMLASPPSCPTS